MTRKTRIGNAGNARPPPSWVNVRHENNAFVMSKNGRGHHGAPENTHGEYKNGHKSASDTRQAYFKYAGSGRRLPDTRGTPSRLLYAAGDPARNPQRRVIWAKGGGHRQDAPEGPKTTPETRQVLFDQRAKRPSATRKTHIGGDRNACPPSRVNVHRE